MKRPKPIEVFALIPKLVNTFLADMHPLGCVSFKVAFKFLLLPFRAFIASVLHNENLKKSRFS
ncbi:MAG: hypothetical protein D6735_04820 [Acidobacteria bacterium]|nr:MAG: hypothetical protein D6735_04820 [Acidobacteriota bacterium]